MQKILIVLATFIVLVSVACVKDEKPETENGQVDSQESADEKISFSDTKKGFDECMKAMLEAVKSEDQTEALKLAESLVLEDPLLFYSKYFGEEKGKKLAEEYKGGMENFREELAAQLVEVFKKQVVEKNRTEVHVFKFTDPGDQNATGLQSDALKNMKEKIALYSVRFLEPGKEHGFHLWNFAHHDGTFRFIMKMRGVK